MAYEQSNLGARGGVTSVGDDTAVAVAPAPSVGTSMLDAVHSDSARMAAGIALTYHGYRRTGSILWALLYGLAGQNIPTVAVPVALAQGFGTRKACP